MHAQLDETIRAEIERSGLTGLTVALVKDGEVVEAAGYGVESTDTESPITPETVFSIQSVTKTLVATTVMQFRDQGKFGLDDPVNRYLAPVSIKNQWEAQSPITVRQLLTHTAGLPVGIGVESTGKKTLDEYVDIIAKTDREPGGAIIYANWGYDSLGLLIERLSGQTLGDCLRDAIFEPLGMQATIFGNPSDGSPHATGHYRSILDGSVHTLPMPDWPVLPAGPAGGCWSSVLDLARLVIAHLSGGGAVLKPETAAEMHRVHAAQGTADSGMGLGFRVTRSNGRHLICHGGDGGGFTAFAGAYPDDGIGVTLLINTGGQQTARSVIANTALRLLAGTPERRAFAGATIAPGLYRSTFWEIAVEAGDDPPTLTATDGLVGSDEAATAVLTRVGDGRFEADGGMFHGFEVAVAGDGVLSGGVYPFEFERVGDVPTPAPIDEGANLIGEWKGTVRTPMAPLAITLTIENETSATLTTPLGPTAVANFRARGGRVECEFPMFFPGIGDLHNFVRIACTGGRLVGKTYVRSQFGENAMPTEMDRA